MNRCCSSPGDICGQAFCHMYWGCRKVGCRGCLNLFKDMEFDDRCLSSLINDNLYESRVLKEYLESKGLSLQDMLQTCSQKLDNGDYHCTGERFNHLKLATSFPDNYTVVHVTKINMHVTPVYASFRLSDSQNVFHHKDMLQVCPQELQRPGISVSQGHTQ